MKRIVALLLAAGVLAGCQTTAQIMDASQPQAISIAQRRAQFEMSCPNATATVLSREEVPPYCSSAARPASNTRSASPAATSAAPSS